MPEKPPRAFDAPPARSARARVMTTLLVMALTIAVGVGAAMALRSTVPARAAHFVVERVDGNATADQADLLRDALVARLMAMGRHDPASRRVVRVWLIAVVGPPELRGEDLRRPVSLFWIVTEGVQPRGTAEMHNWVAADADPWAVVARDAVPHAARAIAYLSE